MLCGYTSVIRPYIFVLRNDTDKDNEKDKDNDNVKEEKKKKEKDNDNDNGNEEEKGSLLCLLRRLCRYRLVSFVF